MNVISYNAKDARALNEGKKQKQRMKNALEAEYA